MSFIFDRIVSAMVVWATALHFQPLFALPSKPLYKCKHPVKPNPFNCGLFRMRIRYVLLNKVCSCCCCPRRRGRFSYLQLIVISFFPYALKNSIKRCVCIKSIDGKFLEMAMVFNFGVLVSLHGRSRLLIYIFVVVSIFSHRILSLLL